MFRSVGHAPLQTSALSQGSERRAEGPENCLAGAEASADHELEWKTVTPVEPVQAPPHCTSQTRGTKGEHAPPYPLINSRGTKG